jgi:hypothetical protein
MISAGVTGKVTPKLIASMSMTPTIKVMECVLRIIGVDTGILAKV